ncbi:MAG: hypothetical protein JNL83_05200 [Myxococcales bacterium]|nr:hypothetical protein [Myxococcales bacterium]
MKLFAALVLTTGLTGAVLADTPAPKKEAPPAKKEAPPAKKEAPPAKDAKTDASPTDVKLFLAFFDKLVDIAVADKDDCKKMAGDLDRHIDANKALLEKAAEAQSKGQKLPDSAREHMMKNVQRLMGAMQKCGADADVQAALNRMPKGGPPPAKPAK